MPIAKFMDRYRSSCLSCGILLPLLPSMEVMVLRKYQGTCRYSSAAGTGNFSFLFQRIPIFGKISTAAMKAHRRQQERPPHWSQATPAHASLWSRIVAAARSTLMLDYDGTLAPFQVERQRALPYPGVEERLRTLAEISCVSVILVTGRSGDELRRMFSLAQRFELWASHGREHIEANGERRLFPVTDRQRKILDEAQANLGAQLDGSAIERKTGSVAVHWRGLPPDEQESIEERARTVYLATVSEHDCARTRDHPIELLPFEDGLELRASGRSKADAVRDILNRRTAGEPVAYLGDDRTDEDAFGALPPEELGILVRPAPRPTLADFWMAPPDELLSFLDGWTAAAGGSAPPAIASPQPHGEMA